MTSTRSLTAVPPILPHLLSAVVGAVLLCGLADIGSAAERSIQAAQIRTRLAGSILPYWHRTGLDYTNGGFILADDGSGNPSKATEKQLVTQTRMIWGFSHAQLKGLQHPGCDYLQAARHGRKFLRDFFYDRENGGYFWTTDLAGKPINRNKILYGQSFVLYGLVELYRASGDKNALQEAMELYREIQKHAHDSKYGGWVEHFRDDWTPMLSPARDAVVEVAGYKSANTHLHLMEAFTELYEATGDKEVGESLREALKFNMNYFYPRDPGRSCFHRQLDWSAVTNSASAGLSYGHNVEFAWLMVRAQRVLNERPAWGHFYAHLDHALKYGYDYANGGLCHRGVENQPANNCDKVWWVQAEMLAALTESLAHKENAAHAAALESLLGFIDRCQADPRDGVWMDTLTAEGRPKQPSKAHNWKANYHDVRALLKFVEAFSGSNLRP